jgi:hypothetical protein
MGDNEILELEEIALECHRGINSLHARLLRAIAGIAARSDGRSRSEQVALLLTWSSNWAADHVALAQAAVERLPASLAALQRGTSTCTRCGPSTS